VAWAVHSEGTLVGPESRGSAPVRIVRGTTRAKRRALTGCIPSARGPATRAASSAPPSMGCGGEGNRGEIRPARNPRPGIVSTHATHALFSGGSQNRPGGSANRR